MAEDESLGLVNEPLDLSNVHPMLSAANNHTIAATNGGTFTGELYDGVTKGLAASVVSAGVSLANSAISIGNILGLGAEEIKTRNVLLNLDDNLAGYYDVHKEGVDIAGEVISAIAPGLGGIKVLKMAQSGIAGNNIMRTTNIFRSIQDDALKLAKNEISNGTVFETYNAARLKAILAGAGDQALQAIAFEMGVATTMQLAPALSKDSIDVMNLATGFAKNTAISTIFGGAIGGVFEAAAVRGNLNRYLRMESKNIRPFEITDDIGKLDIDSGTRVSQMQWQMEQKAKLFDTGTPLTDKEFRTLTDTLKKLETNIRLEMQNLTNGDAPLANKLYDQLKHLPADDFANALTATTKIGRVLDLIPEEVPAHIPAWQAPLKLKNTQLVYDISNTSSKGEVIATDGIVPSVADYATKGKLERLANGNLRAGKDVFKLSGESVENLAPLDANIKWTSYSLAPKMADDAVLDGNNLPQLQRALIDKPSEFRTINMGGQSIENLEDLAIYIRAKKEQAVEAMLREEKSVDVIARTLDVDKAFVEDTTKGNWMLYGITDYTAPQYAVATFSKVSKSPDLFGMEGIKNTQIRIQLAREQAYATTAAYFKDELSQLPKMDVATASPVDRASGFFTSSQGFYGTITAAAEQVGRFITGKAYKNHQDNLDLLFGSRKTIQNDPKLLAEFNAIIGRLRGTDQKFVFDSTGLVFGENTIVSKAYMAEVEKTLTAASKGQPIADKKVADELLRNTTLREPNLDEKIELPEAIANYLRTHTQINDNRIGSLKNLINARGQTSSLSTGSIYVPAVDTTKQNFVAFVKMPDGKFGGSSERASIVAPTAEALQRKIDLVKTKYGNQFEIYTKKEAEEYFKIKGEYDSQLMFNEPSINSTLAREGVLSDIVPRTDSYVFDEIEKWHFRQEQGLIRGMTELHYGQEFAELHALGKQYTDVVTSRALNVSTKTVKNPYEDILRTAMGISRLPENKLWMQLNEFAEATATKAFNTVSEVFTRASKGDISWQEANASMEKYGYKAPYSDLYSLQLANTKIPQPVLQPFIQKMNGVLATAVLRLDFLDTAMNVLSTPVLLGAEVSHIRKNINNPEIVGALSELMNVKIPGGQQGENIPSTFKLIANAITNYFREPALLEQYKRAGWIKNELDLHRELIDISALKGHETSAQLQSIGKRAVDLGVKLTGNDWSQGFTRFIAADVMRQIATTAKVPAEEMVSYINTFVNRVMGNMTASQRPVMFQGAIGNAIGLFQTFQFNMAQNVFRYLETGDKKAVTMLLGMQNSLYGLQSNPAFYAINTYLVGANTKGHEDIISGTYKVAGKDIADWIMYGIGSNALQTNIYSRGDLTPRFASVVPTTVADIPIVNATSRFAKSVWDTAVKLTEVGNKGDILLQGLAQMSINRPLAGIAQVASGTVTTRQGGNLISSSNDLFSLASMSRVAGGKPLDEAIAIDAMYRRNVYKAMDRDRLESIGAAVKTKMRGDGNDLTTDDWKKLTTDYAAAGGRIEQFGGWVHRQFLAANTSVVNKARDQLTDSTVQNMMAVMGGELPDFRNLNAAKAVDVTTP